MLEPLCFNPLHHSIASRIHVLWLNHAVLGRIQVIKKLLFQDAHELAGFGESNVRHDIVRIQAQPKGLSNGNYTVLIRFELKPNAYDL